jgi:hypothetical protein
MQQMMAFILSSFLAASPGGIIIKIPPGINLEEKEVRANLPENFQTGDRYDRIEIVIFYFSQGVEKFTYNGKNSLHETLTPGEIRALVKLKQKGVLRKSLFVSAGGASRDQILHAFSVKMAEIIAKE